MDNAAHIQAPKPAPPRLKPADWLWRPWYAKLWWSAIPVWWIGMAASTRIAPLEAFYDSAAAGFLNLLFFPMTALMVLGVGYAQNWLARFASQGDGAPLSDEAQAGIARLWEEHERGMEDLHASTNVFDPRSGPLWIGNPLSFQHPGRFLKR
ncbi:hypothetical protein ACKU27_03930 [Sphingobium yanoikuyae]|uniref:hypothetical protein n=1 Tax=Sphingobium yanoikuyae TaxID=13690 RepID=UPI003B91BB9A